MSPTNDAGEVSSGTLLSWLVESMNFKHSSCYCCRMVYLQHRVSPHSYSRDRRWDRPCRQSAHLGHFCLQAPLPQTRPVIMDQSPPDHAPHDTRSRPPSSRRCGPGRSGRPPGQLPPRRLVCIKAATARGPLKLASTRSRRGPRAVARVVVAGAPYRGSIRTVGL